MVRGILPNGSCVTTKRIIGRRSLYVRALLPSCCLHFFLQALPYITTYSFLPFLNPFLTDTYNPLSTYISMQSFSTLLVAVLSLAATSTARELIETSYPLQNVLVVPTSTQTTQHPRMRM